ncbi:MAG: hypothetical protein HY692_07205 [Cyanobacteria bacterium NC_groundwater_1444_Ag_S-0.65um_54_12]|nr:hypothetical protein [Cyanobacteria bacterium NC_groundwater_1444_Ag_S-0.65um_54_12]
MLQKNWTLILGCAAFLLVGLVAIIAGATVTTATFRAVIASFLGGILGFSLDYFMAQVPYVPPARSNGGSVQAAQAKPLPEPESDTEE